MKLRKCNKLYCAASVALAVLLWVGTATVQADQILYAGEGFGGGGGSILAYTAPNTYTLFASGIDGPLGLAVNSAGDLYVNEVAGAYGSIQAFTPSGSSSFLVPSTFGIAPGGLAVNSAGDLFEGDEVSGNVDKVTPSGSKTTFANITGDVPGVAVNSAGDVFVAVAGTGYLAGGSVLEYAPGGGMPTTIATLTGSTIPYGVAVSSAGDLYYDDNHGNIYEYNTVTDSAMGIFASGVSADNGLAVDSAGDLFVVSGNSIRDYSAPNTYTTFATGLDNPRYLAFGPSTTSAVPEPSMFALFGISGLVLGGFAWRKTKHTA